METTDVHGVVTAMPVHYAWAEHRRVPGGGYPDVVGHNDVLPPLRVWAMSPSWGSPIRPGNIVPTGHESLLALVGLVAGPPGHHVPLLTLGDLRAGMPVRTMCGCDWRASWSGPGAQRLAHVSHRLQHLTAPCTTSPVYAVGRTRTRAGDDETAGPRHRMYAAEQSMPACGTRSVLLCECGEWGAGTFRHLRSWLAEHDGRYGVHRSDTEDAALRMAMDRDARTEAHIRARDIALTAGHITYEGLREQLADLEFPTERTPSDHLFQRTITIAMPVVSTEYMTTVAGIDIRSVSVFPEEWVNAAAHAPLPDGWVDIGYTTEATDALDALDARLDRFENTAAGIRAALERIDAEDRAGNVGRNDISQHDGTAMRWTPGPSPRL